MTDNDTADPVLYMFVLTCPLCGHTHRQVEQSEEPVALDQSVPWSVPYCPECGTAVDALDRDWDLQAEYEIERKHPTQEANP